MIESLVCFQIGKMLLFGAQKGSETWVHSVLAEEQDGRQRGMKMDEEVQRWPQGNDGGQRTD